MANLVTNLGKNLGARTLFNRLVHHNVKYVFGYPGGAILPVLNEFYNQNKIKYILSKTEAGGSFMAEGYAKATRQPGVVMVTSGPGAINTMTSLQNAMSDGTPLLALTGQVSTLVIGTDAFQEADVIGISKPCTKWNNIIIDGSKINNTIDKAFLHMLNKRHGSVLIDLPKNIMSIESEQKNIEVKQLLEVEKSSITISNIHQLIEKSSRPVILAGQGIFQANAQDLLRRFATRTNIPVTTTLMGLGLFPERHLQSLKMLGMHGSYYANKTIQNSDLLLNFGSRFDDRIIGDPTKFAPNAKIVHIDIESKNINKVIKTPYYINQNCKDVLENLINYGPSMVDYSINKYSKWYLQIEEWKKIKFSYPNKPVLQGRQVIEKLNELIHDDMCNTYTIVADVGAHQMWAAQFIDYNYPKVKWLTSGGLGSMGYALPASIGAKIGLPKDKVICICGDGGFTMSYVELLTAIENKINIKVFIINNSYQLMVKMWQEKFYNSRLVGVKMNNPPFEKVCEAMGCYSIKINSSNHLDQKIKYILDYEDGPIVCNFITDSDEAVLPMVSPGKALDDMIIDEDVKQEFKGEAPC
jgi:acetolactate synthase-1/2/3 large subunit